MTFFNFGRNNRLSIGPVVDDDDYHQIVCYWLSGRVLGCYISVEIPWRRRR